MATIVMTARSSRSVSPAQYRAGLEEIGFKANKGLPACAGRRVRTA